MERTPPQCEDAELSVLGSILLNSDVFDLIIAIINEKHFHNQACAIIFEVIRKILEKNGKIDVVTVGEGLEEINQLEEVGGEDFLKKLLTTVPHPAHGEYYAKLVRDRWVRRTGSRELVASADRMFDLSQDALEIVATVQDELGKLDEQLTATAGSSRLSDLLMDVATEMETGFAPGIKTGFSGVDELTNGFRPGNMIVIGARPSAGKTAFGLCIALNAARAGHHVLFFSVEQTANELAERLLSAESGISMIKLRSGDLSESDRHEIMLASNRLSQLKFDIEDSSSWTVPQMAANARIHNRRQGVDLIVVDYLQLITPERGRDNREQQVSAQSRQLKRMANEIGCPVIVLAQLNREIEKRPNKTPRISDLRESGAIEQDADIVLLLDRPGDFDVNADPELAKVIVAKNRNGPKGDVRLRWRATTMQFLNDDEYGYLSGHDSFAAYQN